MGPETQPPMSPEGGGPSDPIRAIGGSGDPITKACQEICFIWDLPNPIPLATPGEITEADGAGNCPGPQCGNAGNGGGVVVTLPWVDEDGNGTHDFHDVPGLAGTPKTMDEILLDAGVWNLPFDPNNPDHVDAVNDYLRNNPWEDADGDGIPNLTDNFPVSGASDVAFGGVLGIPSGLTPAGFQQWMENFSNAAGLNHHLTQGNPPFPTEMWPTAEEMDSNQDGVVWMAELPEVMRGKIEEYFDLYVGDNVPPGSPQSLWSLEEKMKFKVSVMASYGVASVFFGLRSGMIEAGTALNQIGNLNQQNEIFEGMLLARNTLSGFILEHGMDGSAALEYIPDGSGVERLRVVYRKPDGSLQEFEEAFEDFLIASLPESSKVGDPVNTGNGSFLLKEIDYASPGRGIGFSFARHYSSRSNRRGILGWKWSVPLLETRMLLHLPSGAPMSAAEAYVAWGDGTWGEFTYDVATDTFIGEKGEFSKIRNYSNHLTQPRTDCTDDGRKEQGYTLRNANGIQYHFCPPTFIQGLGPYAVCFLRKITDQDGNSLSFRRNAIGQVEEVTDSFGRVTLFEYTDNNLLESIVDHKGSMHVFGYDLEKEELILVQGPKVHFLDVENEEMRFDNYYHAYEYNQPAIGWEDNNLPALNHNITAVYSSSSIPTTTIEYYDSGDEYEANRVKQVSDLNRVTSFEYEKYQTDYVGGQVPSLAEKIRHKARVTSPEGILKEFYHDQQGRLVWKVLYNDRVNSSGAMIPGSGEAGSPNQWWMVAKYNDEHQKTFELETTDALYPNGRQVDFEFDLASQDRFQQGNLLRITKYPDSSSASGLTPAPRVYEVIYDPLTAKPYAEIAPNGSTTLFHRGHHEQSYDDVKGSALALEWGLLQEAVPLVPSMWGRGDLNGDGVTGGTHRVVERVLPSRATSVPNALGDIPSVQYLNETWRYNGTGAVVWHQDLSGASMETEYVGGYPVIERFDATGLAIENRYTFGTDGQLLTKTDPLGLITVSTYDERGLLVKTTVVSEDDFAHEDCKIAQAGNRKCQIEHGMISIKYRDVTGRIVAEVGPVSGLDPDHTAVPNFDDLDTIVLFNDLDELETLQTNVHNLPNQLNTEAIWTIKKRDGEGQVTAVAGPRGVWTEYEYDSRGQVVRVYRRPSENELPVLQESIEFAWHGGLLAREFPALSTATEVSRFEYTYDDFWMTETVAGPGAWNARYQYNPDGTIRREEAYSGSDLANFREYIYDSWGQVCEVATTRSLILHDGSIGPIAHAPAQIVTRFGYTGVPGQLAWRIDGVGEYDRVTSYQYDALGRPKAEHVEALSGNISTIRQFDAVGRALESKNVMDSRGETGLESPSEIVTTFEYDAYGKNSTVHYADGSKHMFVHDARGHVYFELRPDGTRSLYSNDSAGRILKRTDALDAGSRDYFFEYDLDGNLAAFTEPSGAFTEFTFNELGLLESETVGEGTTSAFTTNHFYNAADLRTRVETQDGVVKEFDYDIFGELIQETASDTTGARSPLTLSYLRNAFGVVGEIKLTKPGSPDEFVRYDRLSTGEAVSRTVVDALGNEKYTQEYNSLGIVHRQIYPSGWTIDRTFDDVGRAEDVFLNANAQATLEVSEHYGTGLYRRATVLGNTEFQTEFDNMRRVTRSSFELNGALVGESSFSYLAGGSIESIESLKPSVIQNFEYDAVNRMDSWTLHDLQGAVLREKSWDYDEADNLTSLVDSHSGTSTQNTVTPNILNQMESFLPAIGANTFLGNGELSQRTLGSESETYGWDAQGRPISCAINDGVGVTTIEWAYSADGSLRKRSDSTGNTETYHYGLQGDLIEISGTDGLRRFIHDVAGGAPVVLDDSGTTHVLQTNWRGDLVRSQADNGGAVVGHLVSPYGLTLDPNTGMVGASGSISPLVGGQIPDKLLGTIRYGARTYDPRVGTFLSRDPLGVGGGANLYAFASNNPWKYSDPSGLKDQGLQAASDLTEKVRARDAASSNTTDYGVIYSEDFVAIREYADNLHVRNWLGIDPKKDFWDLSGADKVRVLNLAIMDTNTALEEGWGRADALQKGIDQFMELRVTALGQSARERELGMVIGASADVALFALDVMDLPSVALEEGLKFVGVDPAAAAWVGFGVGVLQGGRAIWGRAAREGIERGVKKAGRNGCFVAGTLVWSDDCTTKPIEELTVGETVLAKVNPDPFSPIGGLTADPIGPDAYETINPKYWREIHISTEDGSMEAVLLRPLSWLSREGIAIGALLEGGFEVGELQDLAVVTAILPCPEIGKQRPGAQVITGTFVRRDIPILEVWVEGLPEPIETTEDHPFWSVTQHTWIRAGDLSTGETLRGVDGDAIVSALTQKKSIEAVHNIEVHRDHTYAVTSDGIWVHNNCSNPVQAYDVGTYKDLKTRSVSGDDLDIHHAGQAKAMEQMIPDYNRRTAPSIALPNDEHKLIPTLKGKVPKELTPRVQLAKDIRDLRVHTSAPNSAIKELSALNKSTYPGSFVRP